MTSPFVSAIDWTMNLKEKKMRTFESGATRDSDDDKLDYEAFLSPYALKRYAEYLHKHCTQADGKKRDGDNWQKGIPLSAYMKSLWRHLIDLWSSHRRQAVGTVLREDALCAIIFNAMGYLHEITKPKTDIEVIQDSPALRNLIKSTGNPQ